jgi:hypothetical protein
MIISASRRTDIPAYYSKWFLNRIRAGWCQVPNPLNCHQLSYVSLKPEDVTVIVFWSKNPAPLLDSLDELDQKGFRYYFQFTLNDYPEYLEPNLPKVTDRIDTFKTLSERLGDIRVVWRYDPIIISNETPPEFHISGFAKIAESLKGYTKRVMVSFVDYYAKTDSKFGELTTHGFKFDKYFHQSPKATTLIRDISNIANQNGIKVFTCAEEIDFSTAGVTPGCCIDPVLINKIWSIKVESKKDPTQRTTCLCAASKDIGINDTCLHGCTYCYATRKTETALKRHSQHDPYSPAMWGDVRPLSPAEEAHLLATRLL